MTSSENTEDNLGNKRPAWKTTLIEFAVIFVVSVCWNLGRKTGESIVDAFGIAAITAILLYFFLIARE